MSINKKLYDRLSAQIEELPNLGFEKEAGHFAPKIYSLSTREDHAMTTVDPEDLELSVQADLLSSLIKVADFYGVSHLALEEYLPHLEEDANIFIKKYKNLQKITSAYSPFEEKLPGEK
jgi:hypothetical protein